MQDAIRTFIGRVLLVHLALLALLLAIVYFAARSVYGKAREHAINQATQQQDLLAVQTAGAVKSFYDSILSDLQLLHPEEPESATQPALALHGAIGAPLLSRQLQGRASHLFIVDRPRLRIRWIGIQPSSNSADAPTPGEIIVRLGGWVRSLKDPSIDSFVQFGDAGYSVVAVPFGALHNLVLVAVVPAQQLQTLFLDQVDRSSATLLLNDRLAAMAAFRPDLVGTNFATASDPELTDAIDRFRQQGKGTITLDRPFRIGPVDCLAEVNRQLCVQMFNGQFVTMQILVIDCAAGRVEVATAGHPAPLLSTGKSFVPMPLDPQLVLGVERDTHYRSQTFGLQSNWSILLYTDGVVEAERHTGERMGFARLQSALRGPYPTAQELIDAAVRTVDQFREGYALRDDLTLVAVQRPGNGKV